MPKIVPTLLLAAFTMSSSGCFVVRLIVDAAKKRAVRMDKWDVERISLDTGDATGICPRGELQLSVSADAQHKKRKNKHKTLHTVSADPEASKIGKMSFTEFAFTAQGGSIDPATGLFRADDDVLATELSGFAITASYARDAKVKPASASLPQIYDCGIAGGSSGTPGDDGDTGKPGDDGDHGGGGSDEKPGSSGGDAGDAGNGTDGSNGAAGPNIIAYATIVRTPKHDRLVLVKLEGDASDTMLFDPAQPITLLATGGRGGHGGRGGEGGEGGDGGGGNGGGNGGNGGTGGNGANGGDGGPGGTLELVYDASLPELADIITLDASGGAAGAAGGAGPKGDRGFPGNGRGSGGKSGERGTDGSEGAPGSPGNEGSPGQTRARAGDVSTVFGSLPPGITRVQ